MKPGDLLVLLEDVSAFQEPEPHFELGNKINGLSEGDVVIYLDKFINPDVGKDDNDGDKEYACHVLKVLSCFGVCWINDDGSVHPMGE